MSAQLDWLKHLHDRLKEGKIKGFTDSKPEPSGEKKPTRRAQHKIKDWIQLHLEAWCDAHRLKLHTEFMFDTERLWKFDWAIPRKKIAFEYEGLNSKKSRHTTKSGYTGDTDKYNEATAQGWRVYRYTAINHKQLLNDLNKIL